MINSKALSLSLFRLPEATVKPLIAEHGTLYRNIGMKPKYTGYIPRKYSQNTKATVPRKEKKRISSTYVHTIIDIAVGFTLLPAVIGSKKLAPFLHPIKSKTKNSRVLLVQVLQN